jgi:8-amino-7-oxononanoate synthase
LSAQGPRVNWKGRSFLNFASNDYLGLAADPRLARAAAAAARRFGCGAGASALVSGFLPPLRALERDLARWEGEEGALVFSSGFCANLAVVSAVAASEDAIFSDELNHASLIDGCRLSRSRVFVYRHGDMAHLEELLGKEGPQVRRRVVVTDTVFSMDGDLAPLQSLLQLADCHDCIVIADEAHATGVLGENGCGLTEEVGRAAAYRPRLIRVGTLSKALGAQGGFVVGARSLISFLVNFARPYIFSTGLAPPIAAAARRAVHLIEQEPERRRHLLAMAQTFRQRARAMGFNVGRSVCQIVPLIVETARDAIAWSRRLESAGLLVPAIRPPSVPEGSARLRVSLCAGHSEEDISRLLDQLQKV